MLESSADRLAEFLEIHFWINGCTDGCRGFLLHT